MSPLVASPAVRISAKADYAVRALVVLARHAGTDAAPVTVDRIAREGDIPPRFLEGILAEVRRAGLVDSKRGAEGGYRMAHDPAEVRVADVVRVIDGPVIQVAGRDPDDVDYPPSLVGISDVWRAAGAGAERALEAVTLADLLAGGAPDFQI